MPPVRARDRRTEDTPKVPPSAPRPGEPPRRRVETGSANGATGEAPPRPRAEASRPSGASAWRIADAYLVASAALLVELLVVAAIARRELLVIGEVGLALTTLLPIGVAAAAPVAISAGVVAELIARSERWGPRLAVAGLAALGASATAVGVSTGRHLAGASGVAFAIVVGLSGAVGAVALSPWLARLARAISVGRRLALWVGLAGALAVGLEVANVVVLPRLYPAFHAALALLALGGFACLVSLATAPLGPSRPLARTPSAIFRSRLGRALTALLVFAIAAAITPIAAARLSRADNVRLVFHERAPVLAYAVELGALLSPPEPLGEPGLLPPASSGGKVDWKGRDFLLITVDALRADHVGAYGYERPTTPHIDRLAEEGVVFERAYTATPHTSYAVTSLMTGKYVRPLLLMGLGEDSETWADHLRRYDYRTAAFYPPAVFFIDGAKFDGFASRKLGFEYAKVQFSSAKERAGEVAAYLDEHGTEERPRFLWVHLFEPHEPYDPEAEPFGARDVDRYDAEIAEADRGVGEIVETVRASRPETVVIVTADHGEEFGDHGGRYHGTTVYEEQVRVPLVVSAPGLAPRRVEEPVQLVDLLPTVLSGLAIPRPARVRGADLSGRLTGVAPADGGFAFAETDEQMLLARGALRLVCRRRIGACALYDLGADPRQTRDVSASHAETRAMRDQLRHFESSHGKFERAGLRQEGKGWPEALRRGISGDGEAAADIAALLEDADVEIRRRAAEVLFELARPESAAALRLALVRDDDPQTIGFAALALTRLGEGAPRTLELLEGPDLHLRRLAALALAEVGDDRGENVLVAWWMAAFPGKSGKEPEPLEFERAREIASALGHIKSDLAVGPLLRGLDDVRLRPHVARSLAKIGNDAARGALAERLAVERHQISRIALAEALVELGAGPELLTPLLRLLGVPDPLPGGLQIAVGADLLQHIGGPRKRDLDRLRKFATSGVAISVVVPEGSGSDLGVRAICRVSSADGRRGEIRLGRRTKVPPERDQKSFVPATLPEMDPTRSVAIEVAPMTEAQEVFATLPSSMGVVPGEGATLVFYATQNVTVEACALVPLSPELPPPPPEPWEPGAP